MRLKEMLKIKCGKAHFTALETGVVFNEAPVMSWRDSKRGMVVERVGGTNDAVFNCVPPS
ncbi:MULTISPECIES: hypothetical protein [unclassified Bartonella]|uniref:hypothetical protein n=1 Tax=unclassified Bartonella TaxID=2645622 RepID=UPI0035D02181